MPTAYILTRAGDFRPVAVGSRQQLIEACLAQFPELEFEDDKREATFGCLRGDHLVTLTPLRHPLVTDPSDLPELYSDEEIGQ